MKTANKISEKKITAIEEEILRKVNNSLLVYGVGGEPFTSLTEYSHYQGKDALLQSIRWPDVGPGLLNKEELNYLIDISNLKHRFAGGPFRNYDAICMILEQGGDNKINLNVKQWDHLVKNSTLGIVLDGGETALSLYLKVKKTGGITMSKETENHLISKTVKFLKDSKETNAIRRVLSAAIKLEDDQLFSDILNKMEVFNIDELKEKIKAQNEQAEIIFKRANIIFEKRLIGDKLKKLKDSKNKKEDTQKL